ncbi:MAG: hypothetical protein QXH55_00625 [Candidatus Korarchaeota archaeon]|nr:hypothetical protein [Thermoproteota archaeon]MCR8454757.1 hypothetical protein [Thermoproteota archaeon]MCR8462649.1 hypothetical protein [Thermoproteota archaeon]MCR8470268.1 hypothetical protein [Thermoproteota archaeon]MCR8472091.1 hypothetical protein [Thermoproteota archaeon]
MDLSARILGTKKKGQKNFVGIVVYLDLETFLMLEDIADVVGSIDEAITKAIQREHAQLFGGESLKEQSPQINVNELIQAIEQKLTGLLTMSPASASVEPKKIELEMPPVQVTKAAESYEEPLPLESVLDSIIVAEIDSSELKKKEDKAADGQSQQ